MSNEKSESFPTGSLPGMAPIDRLSEHVQFGYQAWMERLQEMQEIEAMFASELLATRDPDEALKICNRWIAKRLDLLAADSKAFSGFWMDLVMTAAGSVTTPGLLSSKGDRT